MHSDTRVQIIQKKNGHAGKRLREFWWQTAIVILDYFSKNYFDPCTVSKAELDLLLL